MPSCVIKAAAVVCYVLALATPAPGQAPPWQWAVEATSNAQESATEVIFDPSSSAIFAGGNFSGNLSAVYGASFTSSYGSTDGFVAKYNSSGSVMWAIKIGGTGADAVTGLAVDPSGNLYVCGTFVGTADFDPSAASFTLNGGSNRDAFLAKYSTAGALLWAVKVGSTQNINTGKLFADANGIYMTGSYSQPAVFYSYNSAVTQTTSSTDLQTNMYGAKYNSNGVVQWVISGGGDKDDEGIDLTADASNVYFVGHYEADITFRNYLGSAGSILPEQNNNKSQVFILAVTQGGNLAWQTNITAGSGGDNTFAAGIAQDAAGLYVTGFADGNINFKYPTPTFTQANVGNKDLFVTKLSKAGSFLWVAAATGNGNNEQIAGSVDVDISGNVLVGGSFLNSLDYSGVGGPLFSSSGGHDVFITAYSGAAGVFQWSIKAGGTTRDYLNAIAVDNTGFSYIAGEQDGSMVVGTTTLTNGGGRNVFVAKAGCGVVSNNTISASQTLCVGSVPNALSGSVPVGGGNYLWQVSANSSTWTTASGTFTGQNYNPPAIAQTTYYRRTVFSTGACSVNLYPSNTVTLFAAIPPTSNAGANQTICATSFTLGAVNPTVGLGSWSVTAGTGTVASVTSASTTIAGLNPGLNKLVWTVTNGVCPPATSTISIYRYAQPSANAGTSQTICATTATLSAVNPTIGSGSWSVLAGTATLISAANFSSQVTGLSVGTNSFLWTVSNGVCTPATSSVTVMRDAQPSSSAGANQTVCGLTANLAAVNPTVGTGLWSVVAGTGTVAASANPTTQVSGLSTGTNTLLWTVSNGVCPAATSSLTIVRDAQPTANAGASQTICATTATLSAVNSTVGSGSWSVLAGTATLISAANFSSQVTGLSVGTNSFLWTVSNGVCSPATSTVTVTRDAQPTASAGSNQTVCALTANLAAVNPTVGTGLWSVLAGTGTVAASANPITQVSGLSTGTNTLLWTVFNGVCPAATSSLTIVRDAQPAANAGSSQTICASTVTLSAVNPTVGSGSWSVLAGTATLISAANFSSQVTGLSIGTNSFLWTVSNGVCTPASSTVFVVVDAQPVSNAGSAQMVCSTIATLSAQVPSVGTGSWSVLGGSALVTAAGNPSSTVTVLTPGLNTFVWTVVNGVCAQATSTTFVTRDLPPTANAGADQTLCVSSTTLVANTPSVGTGLWTLLSGTASLGAVNSPTLQASALGAGSNYFAWTVSNGICAPAISTVLVQRDIQPTAYAGIDQTVCATSVTLSAQSPSIGAGAWSVSGGSANVTSPGSPVTVVNGLNTGFNGFTWMVINGVCPPAISTVSVQRDEQPVANAGSNQTICSTSTSLAALAPNVGTGLWSVAAGTATLSAPNDPLSAVIGLSSGSTIFVWTVSHGVCSPAVSSMTVVRDEEPSPAMAQQDVEICGDTLTIRAETPLVGSGAWQVITGSGQCPAPLLNQTHITQLSVGRNKLTWTIANGSCPVSVDTVEIASDEPPSVAMAGDDLTTCSAEVSVQAVSPRSGDGLWTWISGPGTITSSLLTAMTVSFTGDGVVCARWTTQNGVCPPSADTIHIRKISGFERADAGPDLTVETASVQLEAVLPASANGKWSVVEGNAILDDAGSPTSTCNRLAFGLNTFKWTIYNAPCPELSDEVNIYVKPFMIPNAISPNSDGYNDRFVITSLDYYSDVKFTIYDRWGTMLYKTDNYRNDWAGTSQSNDPLPDDTYYYVLEIPGSKTLNGFINVKKSR